MEESFRTGPSPKRAVAPLMMMFRTMSVTSLFLILAHGKRPSCRGHSKAYDGTMYVPINVIQASFFMSFAETTL